MAQQSDGLDMDNLDYLLTSQEYAEKRRCSNRTAERERSSGTGCRYIKIGRAVRYRLRDVLDFIERHARQSTSDATPVVAAGVAAALGAATQKSSASVRRGPPVPASRAGRGHD
jgi:hypothetical protein